MTAAEAIANVRSLVRIRSGRTSGSSQHWMRGVLLGVVGADAVVQPFRHKHSERVPLADVKLWKSRNAEPTRR